MPLLPILLLVLMVLPDLYIWLSFVRGAVAPVWSLLYWLPFVLTLLGVLAFMMGYANHFVLNCSLSSPCPKFCLRCLPWVESCSPCCMCALCI